jgi:intracellular sulfur oxidation DsrE/DsrF family protein
MTFSRRKFVGGIGTSVAAITAFGAASTTSQAQLVDQFTNWDSAEFSKLIHLQARAKQVYDIRPVADGKFLNNIKNSLNGFHYGYNIPNDQIKILVAMHGPSNTLAFDDAMWKKYRLGEFVDVTDPETGKPATRNIFLPKKPGYTSTETQAHNSKLQDTSIATLQERGVKFLSCHTATEEEVEKLVKKFSLKTPAEEIVQDLQAHILPGVLIVPSMVATVALLQSEGHYTYITV